MIVKISKPLHYGVYESSNVDLYNVSDDLYYYCRDSFHEDYNVNKGLLAFKGSINSVKNIINIVENKIKVPIKQKATYFQTNYKEWIAINPKWWSHNNARIGLFTILLRASKKCRTLKSLYNFDYLIETKDAFKLFLNGNTDCDYDFNNWVDNLYNSPFDLYNNTIKQKNKSKIKKIEKILCGIQLCDDNGDDVDPDKLAYHILKAVK